MAKIKYNAGIEMAESDGDPMEFPEQNRVLLSADGGNFYVSRENNTVGRILTDDRQKVATKNTIGSVIVGRGISVEPDGEISVEKEGHVIEDKTGTEMPQRTNLRFEGSGFTNVSDNESEDATIVRLDNPMTTEGDMIVGGFGGVPAAIAGGGWGQVLTMGANVPGWRDPAMINPMTELGQLIVGDDDGAPVAINKGTGNQVLGHVIPNPDDPDDPNRLEVAWVRAIMPNDVDNDFTTNVDFDISGDTVVAKQFYKNIATGATKEIDKTIPLADTTHAGLMAEEDVATIASHETRISALEGGDIRYAVTIPDDPSQDELTDLYDAASGKSGDPDVDGVRLIDVTQNITYVWFLSDETWHGPESDTVAIFTNTSPGIILGSPTAGKVYAETDGTGSVYGWDALNTAVAGKQDTLTFSPTSAVEEISGAVDVKVDGTTILKNPSTGALSSAAGGAIPIATTTILGGIKPDGKTLEVDSATGVASVVEIDTDYWLPSADSTDFTLGASGDSYTSPGNGWLSIAGETTITNGNITVNINDGERIIYGISYSGSRMVTQLIPISEGDAFTFSYGNITINTFKFIPEKGMRDNWLPSADSTDFTLGASGDSYTSPGNGWLSIAGVTSITNGNFTINVNEGAYLIYGISYSSSRLVTQLIPISEGDTFVLSYGSIAIDTFKFIPAKGTQNDWLPSAQSVDFAPEASGDSYTSPEDGWLHIVGVTSITNGNFTVNVNNGAYLVYGISYSAGRLVTRLIPISKGDTFTLSYGSIAINTFKFIYSKGAADGHYKLPIASATKLGGIKVGDNLTITDGVLSANPGGYTLPIAAENTLGGIKPDGVTLEVDPDTGVATVVDVKTDISDWLPSTQYEEFTLGSSGDSYTSPGNGWLYVSSTTTSTNGNFLVSVNDGAYTRQGLSYSSNRTVTTFCPISAGDTFVLTYTNMSFNMVKFISAKGTRDDWLPSDQSVDYTLGSSGDSYTSPGNGWLYVSSTTTSTNGNFLVSVNGGAYTRQGLSYSSNRTVTTLVPISAGDIFVLTYTNMSFNTVRFISAKGTRDDWLPSTQYAEFTLGSSGESYTAPANGWLYVSSTTTSTNGNFLVSVNGGAYTRQGLSYSSNRTVTVMIPISAGDTFVLTYTNMSFNVVRFIYEKGALGYILPIASANTLGGIKVGSRLTIANGVLSADDYALPTAADDTLGGIKVGENLTITDGVLSAQTYTLPIATPETLGGMKPDGITITVNPDTGIASTVASPNDWLPSEQYVDFTLGASGELYTAPANGWLHIVGVTSTTNGNFTVNVNNGAYIIYGITYSSSRMVTQLIPVSAGDTFVLSYGSITINTFKFIYSKGEI